MKFQALAVNIEIEASLMSMSYRQKIGVHPGNKGNVMKLNRHISPFIRRRGVDLYNAEAENTCL